MIAYIKHATHVVALLTIIGLFQIGVYKKCTECPPPDIIDRDPSQIDWWIQLIFTISQYFVILSLPQILCNFLGLTLFNAFPGSVTLNQPLTESIKTIADRYPHLCLRIVTRGLYHELVQYNVNKNFTSCIEAGLQDFAIEVVTDNKIPLTNTDTRIRQIVVPDKYRTSTGAMYKARALQYALEPGTSPLKDGDYIVHLDEETIVTRDCLYGIINFALEGTYDFGQGLITYTHQGIVNYLTTLADSFRVGDDMGKVRFQFRVFHKPLFGWKGSYVVSKYAAEKHVTYDHGPKGSIAEDCYFGMVAITKGYKFNFIEGEMWEKSPFTVCDLIRQRKRWLQGILLVVLSKEIPVNTKFFLTMSTSAWISLPITVSSLIASFIVPMQVNLILSSLGTFSFSVTIYMYIFGILKSFDLKDTGIMRFLLYLMLQVLAIILNAAIEYVAVVWGLCTSKYSFYLVEKQSGVKNIVD